MRRFYIDIKYATFGICTRDDIILCAPPIAKWMIGKSLSQIKPWLLSQKAYVIEL